MRDIIEVLLGTALRIGECLAVRVWDVDDAPSGMTISVTSTVVLRTGSGAVRKIKPLVPTEVARVAAALSGDGRKDVKAAVVADDVYLGP